jgi:hypothetical protein
MVEFTSFDLVGSLALTRIIVLTPPLVLQYLIIGNSLSKGLAVSLCALLWLFILAILIALDSKYRSHAALVHVAFVSYWILHTEPQRSES